jgi:hypothetical protein
MKIEAAKCDLEAALQVVNIAVGSGGNDLSTHYLFRGTKDSGMEVLAYHQRVFASAPIKCVVETPEDEDTASFTAAAWRMNRWLEGVRDGVVTMDYNGNGEVRISGARATARFESLDPTKFPYWDKGLEEAASVGDASPTELAMTLSHARKFTADEDTTQPQFAQVEARDGILWSSDRFSVSMIDVNSVPKLGIRVNTKDIPAVVKFLSLTDTSDTSVEVLENSSTAFFKRADGALIGVSRPPVQFPNLKIDRAAEPAASFDLSVTEFQDGVLQLSASAAKDNTLIRIKYGENDEGTGNLILSMDSDAGGTCEFPMLPTQIENGDAFTKGFDVDFPYIQSIAASFSLDTIRMGVHPVGDGGYLSFCYSKPADTDAEADADAEPNADSNGYYAVIVWKR